MSLQHLYASSAKHSVYYISVVLMLAARLTAMDCTDCCDPSNVY
jgi:hypothetical protein